MKEIKLTQGKVALVDDEDYEYLNQFKWCAWSPNGVLFYAKRGEYIKETQATKIVYMHRVIIGATDNRAKIDHRDHNGLNNQRKNLRIAEHSQNIAHMENRSKGSSKYLGVYWSNTRRKWVAEITKNNTKKHLGVFTSEQDAAIAYNKKAVEFHGEFASLNPVGN